MAVGRRVQAQTLTRLKGQTSKSLMGSNPLEMGDPVGTVHVFNALYRWNLRENHFTSLELKNRGI